MLNLTTEQFAKISSKVILALPEALKGLSYEEGLKLAEPENLKRAFLAVVGDRDHEEEEVVKFLDKWKLDIVEDLEQGPSVPMAQTRLITFLEGDKKKVGGETMIKLSRQKGAMAGIRQALYDATHTGGIPPEEWNLTRIYAGTILRRRGGANRHVLVLYIDRRGWNL